jgi:hypothetical protein
MRERMRRDRAGFSNRWDRALVGRWDRHRRCLCEEKTREGSRAAKRRGKASAPDRRGAGLITSHTRTATRATEQNPSDRQGRKHVLDTIGLPAEDLKPLYDNALACKGCQAQLAAAQADLKDEKTKTATLGRERDDALRVARGGSVLRRVARAAKWFVIGAAAGALAVRCTR